MTNAPPALDRRFAVAPMMDGTDRHCRFLHRQISRRALLYTEMLTAAAVIHGDRERLLGFDPGEHPLALQLGGADPDAMARAAAIGAEYGYDEININVGCPSDRVQAGRFGACLMREPETVAACIAAMRRQVNVPVTVKCRIGLDDGDDEGFLHRFVATVADAGCGIVIVHARNAVLSGLSPKQNREVPPLRYPVVHRLKAAFPRLRVILNGGLADHDVIADQLAAVDGVMVGRQAYREPYWLAEVDARVFADARPPPSRDEVLAAMRPYIARRLAAGDRLHAITRHLLGLYQGRPGARAWRRYLGANASRPGAGLTVLDAAAALIRDRPDRRSA